MNLVPAPDAANAISSGLRVWEIQKPADLVNSTDVPFGSNTAMIPYHGAIVHDVVDHRQAPGTRVQPRPAGQQRLGVGVLRVGEDLGHRALLAQDAVAQCLELPATQQRFRAGGVTFCTLMPMRAIPFEVVCLLGMNDGEYPRRTPRNQRDGGAFYAVRTWRSKRGDG